MEAHARAVRRSQFRQLSRVNSRVLHLSSRNGGHVYGRHHCVRAGGFRSTGCQPASRPNLSHHYRSHGVSRRRSSRGRKIDLRAPRGAGRGCWECYPGKLHLASRSLRCGRRVRVGNQHGFCFPRHSREARSGPIALGSRTTSPLAFRSFPRPSPADHAVRQR